MQSFLSLECNCFFFLELQCSINAHIVSIVFISSIITVNETGHVLNVAVFLHSFWTGCHLIFVVVSNISVITTYGSECTGGIFIYIIMLLSHVLIKNN